MIDSILGLIGRTLPPDLPEVDALDDAELERLAFEAMQNRDLEKVARIRRIRELRAAENPGAQIHTQVADLMPTNPRSSDIRTFGRRAVGAYQDLNDALLTRPQR
jgi:hypothetical protein